MEVSGSGCFNATHPIAVGDLEKALDLTCRQVGSLKQRQAFSLLLFTTAADVRLDCDLSGVHRALAGIVRTEELPGGSGNLYMYSTHCTNQETT